MTYEYDIYYMTYEYMTHNIYDIYYMTYEYMTPMPESRRDSKSRASEDGGMVCLGRAAA